MAVWRNWFWALMCWEVVDLDEVFGWWKLGLGGGPISAVM